MEPIIMWTRGHMFDTPTRLYQSADLLYPSPPKEETKSSLKIKKLVMCTSFKGATKGDYSSACSSGAYFLCYVQWENYSIVKSGPCGTHSHKRTSILFFFQRKLAQWKLSPIWDTEQKKKSTQKESNTFSSVGQERINLALGKPWGHKKLLYFSIW